VAATWAYVVKGLLAARGGAVIRVRVKGVLGVMGE
jgi:hypothetical protein